MHTAPPHTHRREEREAQQGQRLRLFLTYFLCGLMFLLYARVSSASPSSQTPASRPAAKRAVSLSSQAITASDLVVQAKVSKILGHSVAESYPPIHTLTFTVVAAQVLKGTMPNDRKLTYSVRGDKAPLPQKGKRYIFSGNCLHQTLSKHLTWCNVKSFQAATTKRWETLQREQKKQVASRGDIPKSVRFTVEQVRPRWQHDWVNAYGDGKFRLVLYNPTLQPITITALKATGRLSTRTIYWKQALQVAFQGKIHQLKGARKPIPKSAKALVLGARETVSFVVDVLPFPLKHWPGGARLNYQLRLGAQSRSSFFYFSHKYHLPMHKEKRKTR